MNYNNIELRVEEEDLILSSRIRSELDSGMEVFEGVYISYITSPSNLYVDESDSPTVLDPDENDLYYGTSNKVSKEFISNSWVNIPIDSPTLIDKLKESSYSTPWELVPTYKVKGGLDIYLTPNDILDNLEDLDNVYIALGYRNPVRSDYVIGFLGVKLTPVDKPLFHSNNNHTFHLPITLPENISFPTKQDSSQFKFDPDYILRSNFKGTYLDIMNSANSSSSDESDLSSFNLSGGILMH